MNLEKKVLKIYLYNIKKSLIFLILYGRLVIVNIKKRKKSKFTSILPIFSLMVVPVYLTLVCGDSTPMTSLQDGELRLF